MLHLFLTPPSIGKTYIKSSHPTQPFHYHKPHQIIGGTPNWWGSIAVLLMVTGVTFVAAMVVFERRDLTR